MKDAGVHDAAADAPTRDAQPTDAQGPSGRCRVPQALAIGSDGNIRIAEGSGVARVLTK